MKNKNVYLWNQKLSLCLILLINLSQSITDNSYLFYHNAAKHSSFKADKVLYFIHFFIFYRFNDLYSCPAGKSQAFKAIKIQIHRTGTNRIVCLSL